MPDASRKTNRSGRQLTEAELAARRANAQKSTGPKTAEGKRRSSQNARRHGLFGQTALLDSESPDDFVALRDAYLAEFDPQGPAETHLVMEMANAQWRLRRVRGIEADLIDHIIGAEIDSWRFPASQRQAEAVRRLADSSHVLALLVRYETMFRRQYERALRLLWEHRDRQRRPVSAAAERRCSSGPGEVTAARIMDELEPIASPPPSHALNSRSPRELTDNQSPAARQPRACAPDSGEAPVAAAVSGNQRILQNEPEPSPALATSLATWKTADSAGVGNRALQLPSQAGLPLGPFPPHDHDWRAALACTPDDAGSAAIPSAGARPHAARAAAARRGRPVVNTLHK